MRARHSSFQLARQLEFQVETLRFVEGMVELRGLQKLSTRLAESSVLSDTLEILSLFHH